MKRGSTILNSRTGRTGASSAGLFDTEAFNTLRQTRGSTLLRFSCVKVSRLVRTVIRQVRMGTPYRLLCNDVQREDAKPSPDLASWLYSNVPLHKIRYGIPSIVQGLFMPVNSARMSVAWTVICMKPVLQRLKRRVHPRKLHIELFIERSLLRIYLLNCF